MWSCGVVRKLTNRALGSSPDKILFVLLRTASPVEGLSDTCKIIFF